MIKAQTCYTVACDDCKKAFEHDYVPHWPDPKEARWEAEESEWWIDEEGTLDLCSECRLKTHPFRLKPNTTDECWRCCNPAEEHEEVAAVSAVDRDGEVER